MTAEHRCPRCGTPLRTETVRVPVYLDTPTVTDPHARVLIRYEDQEEVSDCVRCTGSY